MLQHIEGALAALPYPERPEGLYDPIRFILAGGGKRLRPMLLLTAYSLYHSDFTPAVSAAIGIEMYHNHTLVHDDLMDHADVRRGRPTVHKRWNENTAVLSGDTMLLLAYRLIAQSTVGRTDEVMRLFTDSAIEICEGQQYDVNFESRSDVTEAEYLEMIRLKTSVLLGCALELGALVGGASEVDAKKLYEAGISLGLAFQIQDDLLDVYGEEATFGKPIGGDIIHAKKTLLLLHTLETLTGTSLEKLEALLSLTLEERKEQVDAVRALYDEAGTRAFAEGEVTRLTTKAYQQIEALSLHPERKALLLQLFDTLSGRTK